ncbi:MAG: polysaccharide deacetylase family protein [Methylacidiphilales bacterium]|nr:polysaccharide deacetylase family protein [Candidatus Methylacidiphilales bacterium]
MTYRLKTGVEPRMDTDKHGWIRIWKLQGLLPTAVLFLLPLLPVFGAEKKAASDPLAAPYLEPELLSVQHSLYPEALWQGQTKEKVVALSFDDGPSRYTPALLDVLKRKHVSATFFVLANRAARFPETVRREQQEGHRIGLHGRTHASLHGMPDAEIVSNLQQAENSVREILGPQNSPSLWYFRAPFLDVSHRIIRTAESCHTRVVMCTIMPGEQLLWPNGWRELPGKTTKRVLRDIGPGGIICLHDGQDLGLHDGVEDCPYAARNASEIIDALRERGYKFVTIDKLDKR